MPFPFSDQFKKLWESLDLTLFLLIFTLVAYDKEFTLTLLTLFLVFQLSFNDEFPVVS